jgi:hypothetical protein
MVVNVETEDDELMLAVQIELDRTVAKEVCDAVYEIASLPPEEKTPQNYIMIVKAEETLS